MSQKSVIYTYIYLVYVIIRKGTVTMKTRSKLTEVARVNFINFSLTTAHLFSNPELTN